MRELVRRLTGAGSHELADPYAEAVLETARGKAAGHPSPQARMAASGLEADRGTISSPPGRTVYGSGGSAPLEAIIGGAEFGSNRYRQFAPARRTGYFLMPATRSKPPREAGNRVLDEIVRKVIA